MNYGNIDNILPQRYPFLLIDKVVLFEKDKKLVAIKNISINEEYFKGHFPDSPIMPGVLVLETMAQAVMVFLNLRSDSNCADKNKPDIYYLCSVKARFLHSVKPGDQLVIEVIPIKVTLNMGMLEATAKVDGREVARAEIGGARRK